MIPTTCIYTLFLTWLHLHCLCFLGMRSFNLICGVWFVSEKFFSLVFWYHIRVWLCGLFENSWFNLCWSYFYKTLLMISFSLIYMIQDIAPIYHKLFNIPDLMIVIVSDPSRGFCWVFEGTLDWALIKNFEIKKLYPWRKFFA